MRPRRTQNAAVQHAGKMEIDGEHRAPGDLGAGVLARNRLADNREVGVGRQRRRFIGRNFARHFAETDRKDAARKGLGTGRRRCHFGSSRLLSPFLSRPGGRERRRDDVGIGAATAIMPADRGLDIRHGRIGGRSSSAAQLITSPGVQKPHCTASCSMKAACTGCSGRRAQGLRPS